MRNRICLILIGLFIISGCGQESLNEHHKQYLADRGWEINKATEVKTYILNMPQEVLSDYEASGITFLEDYVGQEVTSHTYELKETDTDGERLKAVVFEAEDDIIGGFGVLPNWSPGRFDLSEKERLINDNKIKQ
ncbi:DUF4830 domain-containing protein [Caldalkalibacillus salinus]|uniref:DUF4830 domain-containing protein n=1 Tax=Caldalkalibacillus salinus TaxID=2803787 RepID=UPI00192290BC|nr:DUF4830 domain-containing protein [Caldalkalibacillus salinus]